MGKFERDIDLFDSTIDWMMKHSVDNLSNFLKKNEKLPLLFIASGGSYSAAALAETLAVNNGYMAHALTPYMYLESGFKDIPAKVLLITASGNNVDAHRVVEHMANCQSQEFGVLMVNNKSSLTPRLEELGFDNVFVYSIDKYNRDGFLATNTLLAFYILFHKVYDGRDLDILKGSPDEQVLKEIDDFVNKLKHISDRDLDNQQAFLHKLEGVDSFFVLYSAHNAPVGFDIESKFSEGGIGNTQLADYRNFAHGRFNWFTQRPGQTGLICLQSPGDAELSGAMMEKLLEVVPILKLHTAYTGSLGIIHLFIQAQYLCIKHASRWGLDLGRPFVPEYGKEIHNM